MQPFKLEIKQKSVTLKMQTTVNIFSKAEKRERERERERESTEMELWRLKIWQWNLLVSNGVSFRSESFEEEEEF
jgi:hypothetical protein